MSDIAKDKEKLSNYLASLKNPELGDPASFRDALTPRVLDNLGFYPRTETMTWNCPKCGAETAKRTYFPYLEPYSGNLECSECQYSSSFMEYVREYLGGAFVQLLEGYALEQREPNRGTFSSTR